MSRRFDQQYADPKGGIIRNLLGDITFGQGTTVPSDNVAGFAPNCLFLDIDATGGAGLYINRGTRTACNFDAFADLAALTTTVTELNLLSGLLATATEINRATDVSTRLVASGASLAVTLAAHDGKTIVVAASAAITLPASAGTGARFRFILGADATAVTITATGAHLFGKATMLQDGGDTLVAFESAGSTVITLNGSTTGGKKGDIIEIEDIATNTLFCYANLTGTGTEATPFS